MGWSYGKRNEDVESFRVRHDIAKILHDFTANGCQRDRSIIEGILSVTFLKIGHTIAFFQSAGTTPWCKEAENNSWRQDATL